MANMYKSNLEVGGITPTGNATSADVLTGKTFMNSNGAQTGSMTNNGAVSGTATPSQPYTIPEGYHNGQGVVTASGSSGNPVVDLTDNTYVDVSFANGVTVTGITSGTAISISNRGVFGNIKDFTTAATYGQGIGSNTKVSNDGVTWVTVSAGTGNVSSYKYFMAVSGNANVTITFT